MYKTIFDKAVERSNEKFAETGICNYCLEEIGNLKKVRLRKHFKAVWQRKVIWIGKECRKHLKGFFKYAC